MKNQILQRIDFDIWKFFLHKGTLDAHAAVLRSLENSWQHFTEKKNVKRTVFLPTVRVMWMSSGMFFHCTVKKENKTFLLYKEIQKGAVAKSYMRKGFLIYEEKRKYLFLYEEAVSHIWLCNCSLLNFLIYEENFLFFLSVWSLNFNNIVKKLRFSWKTFTNLNRPH